MKLKCPKCDVYLPTQQMNVDNDVAICHDCGEIFSISELMGVDSSFDINDPPLGVSYDNSGIGWRIASTTRNASTYFLVPFTFVWSGLSIGGIYGGQIVRGEFDPAQSLLGIPFILGTLVLGLLTLLSIVGRSVVRRDELDHDAGSVFLGVGPIGWTTRFRWSEITNIDESLLANSEGQDKKQITLYRNSKDIHFGLMLTEQRRRYVLRALRQLVSSR
ncbi:hypothetical protein GC197_14210 [bacterium]|nr:hypothetical protein [bacterium]